MPTLYSAQGEDKDRIHLKIIRGDTDTSPTEKQYLLAVEKGDYSGVHNFLEESAIYFNLNINCVDALGRTALHIAIENENIEIIELLLSYNVEVGDALLFAIEEEVVQAVEILLNYKQPKAGKGKKDQFSMSLMTGQKQRESNFTPDITPVILGAHKNNYEILKLLVSRGATIVKPHPVKCGCYECVHSATFDSLRHSQTRMNAYRALASPSLMILSSDDPILTAFELSWELYHLSFSEVEFKEEYVKLSEQCTKFAVDLLDQTRGSQELKVILNRTTDQQEILALEDQTENSDDHSAGHNMNLSRFKLAIEYRQKEFIAHPNCQQLLSHIWYQGIPGWRQGTIFYKAGFTFLISLTFPFTSLFYLFFPFTKPAKVLKNPFVKFINHSASYITFLVLLILASQEGLTGSTELGKRDREPNVIEWIIVSYVFAFVWSEMKEIWETGFLQYSRDLWNIMDFMQNTLYLACITLRAVVYFGPDLNIEREEMTSSDPMLVAEALFAVANIFSTMRLLILFIANSHLGPLQISVGRMIIDIIKFLFVFALVIISFASGMNQLLYLEYESSPYTVTGDCEGVVCTDQNRQFKTIIQAVITLYWTVMGIVDLSAVSVNEKHAFTKQVAMIMYMVYHIIAIVILLNMLIAMMNLSYEQIVEHADVEWKYARSRMWMSYFEEGQTLPAPFSIIPSPKSWWKCIVKLRTFCVADLMELQRRQKIQKLAVRMKELERKYQDVLTNLTQRYIANIKKTQDIEPVTEDDLNEIKQDISAFRYEVVELLRKGVDDSTQVIAGGSQVKVRTINNATRRQDASIYNNSKDPKNLKASQLSQQLEKNKSPANLQPSPTALTVEAAAAMAPSIMNTAAKNFFNAPSSSPSITMVPVVFSKGPPPNEPVILSQDPNNPNLFITTVLWTKKEGDKPDVKVENIPTSILVPPKNENAVDQVSKDLPEKKSEESKDLSEKAAAKIESEVTINVGEAEPYKDDFTSGPELTVVIQPEASADDTKVTESNITSGDVVIEVQPPAIDPPPPSRETKKSAPVVPEKPKINQPKIEEPKKEDAKIEGPQKEDTKREEPKREDAKIEKPAEEHSSVEIPVEIPSTPPSEDSPVGTSDSAPLIRPDVSSDNAEHGDIKKPYTESKGIKFVVKARTRFTPIVLRGLEQTNAQAAELARTSTLFGDSTGQE